MEDGRTGGWEGQYRGAGGAWDPLAWTQSFGVGGKFIYKPTVYVIFP